MHRRRRSSNRMIDGIPRLGRLIRDAVRDYVRGRVRAVRFNRRARRSKNLPAEARSYAFSTRITTPAGHRKRALLLKLIPEETLRRLRDTGWGLEDATPSPIALDLVHRDGRRLVIPVRSRKDPGYAETRHFSVVYRPSGGPSDEDVAAVDLVVAGIKEAENDLVEGTDVPQVLLEPDTAELVILSKARRLELRLSLACSHRCGFCGAVDDSVENLRKGVPDVLATVGDWEEHDIWTVVVTGGEPTLHRDLPQLLSVVADRGYKLELQTNGMKLADRAYTRHLKRSGLRTVLISLHSHDPENSDQQITRVEGAWQRTVDGIDAAVDAGLRVRLSHVIHSANYTQTREFFALVHRRWGRKVPIRLAFVIPVTARPGDIGPYVPALPDVIPHLKKALAFADEHGMRLIIIGNCGVPPCLVRPYERFCEVAEDLEVEFLEDHTQLPACANCDYSGSCPGIRTLYYEHYGDPGLRPMSRR